MFKQRVITALVLAPLALAAVFYLPLGGFAVFISVAFLLGAWEWSGFCGLPNRASRVLYVLLTAAILALLYWQLPVQASWPIETNLLLSSLLLSGIGWWLLAIALVLTYPRSQRLWAPSCR